MNNKISILKFHIFLVSFAGLAFYYVLYLNAFDMSITTAGRWVYILSLIGIFELIYVIHSWKLITGRYITLYTLFMIFFFLFNYGQSMFWALGIHIEGEIGSKNLYYYLPVPSSVDIFQTQLIVLISGLMIHFGAVFFKKKVSKGERKSYFRLKPSSNQKVMYKFSKFIAPIIIFSEYYTLFLNYRNAQMFGYTALYYNPEIVGANVIFKIFSRLFFPVLIGLLIGSGYDKKVMRTVYTLFTIDVILSILIGDRGGWFYALCLFVVSHHYFYKKIRLKQFWVAILFVAFISYISVAVVAVRNTGVTIDRLLSVISNLEINPFVSSIFSMGSTMGVTTVLVMSGWDIFPYGNTFLYGLLIAPSKDVINLLNLNYESVGGWFSQVFLGISNGAGFSIVAEALINFGPFVLPFFMILFGLFIGWITDIEYRDPRTQTQRILLCFITTSVIINISRNVFSYNMGEVFYTTVQFFAYYFVYKTFFIRKHNNEIIMHQSPKLGDQSI